MRFLICIFCIFASTTYCLEKDPSSSASIENEPSSLIEGTVSAITGELYLFDNDLVIPGAEPIYISRYYRSQKEDKWDFFPQRLAKRIAIDGKQYFQVKEPNGVKLLYAKKGIVKEGNENWTRYELDLSAHPGLSNTSQGIISPQSNLKNNYLAIDSKGKYLNLHCSDGSWRCYKKIPKKEVYHLLSERLANQHQIFYEYDDFDRIINIRTTNPAGNKIFASAEIKHIDGNKKGKIKNFDLRTNDGRLLQARSRDGGLVSLKSPDGPDKQYDYLEFETPDYQTVRKLSIAFLPLDRYMQYRYYDRDRQTVAGMEVVMQDDVLEDEQHNRIITPDKRRLRVRDIQAPAGSNCERKSIASIFYERDENKTTVLDSNSNQTIYSWNDDLRLISIERQDPVGNLLNSEHFVWGAKNGSNAGNLLCRTFCDSQNEPVYSRAFTYDSCGAVLEEKLYGNLSGKGSVLRVDSGFQPMADGVEVYKKRFTYSKDRHLLIKKEEDNQRTVQYEYFSNTNLPSAEFTGYGMAIKIRKFWEYDSDNILIREIVDDGASKLKESLQGVSERLIREITPKPDAPYLGMPSIIQEKYWNGRQELLLKKTVLNYTAGGQIAQKDVYDANETLRYRITTTFDEKGRPLSETNALGQTQTHQYNEVGNEIVTTDAAGIQTHRTFDLMNRLRSQETIGHGNCLSRDQYDYNEHNRLITEKHSSGSDCSYDYDSWGRATGKQLPLLRTPNGALKPLFIQSIYDCEGHLIQETDPEGNSTQTAFNARGQPISILHPDGFTESLEYNLDGTLRSQTDSEGVATVYQYDFLGRMISQIRSQSGTVLSEEKWSYNSFHLTGETDAEGNITQWTYDGAGRLIQQSQCGEKTVFSYDSLGRRTCVQTGSLQTAVDYDLLDRIVQERKMDLSGQVLTSVSYEYDAAGQCIRTTRQIDGQMAVERRSYDDRGRLIEQIDPENHRTLIAYEDNLSAPLSFRKIVTDPLGTVTATTYDAYQQAAFVIVRNLDGKTLSEEESFHQYRGDLLQQTSKIFDPPRRVTTQWSYDAMGYVASRTDAAGSGQEKTTRFAYSPSGHLSEMVKPDGVQLWYSYTPIGDLSHLTSSDHTIDYSFIHDRCGHLLQSTDGNTAQTLQRKYNGCGRLTQETFPTGRVLENRFDAAGRRIKFLLPDGSSVDYDYDALFLRSVSRCDSMGHIRYRHAMLSYDESGHLLEESLLGDLGTVRHSHDLCSRTTALDSPFSHTRVVQRDPMGNILELESNGHLATYTYDCLSQLTSESGPCTHRYQTDAQFCREQKDDEAYTVNALLEIPSHLTYDANGNPTGQGDALYRYDALDRLMVIETPGSRRSFTYDSDHRRLSQTTSTLDNGVWKEEKLFFLYDGSNEIGAFDETGTIVQLRVLASSSHAEIGAAISIELNGQVFAPLHDLQGNVESLISLDTKQPVATYRYSAFGEEQIGGVISPWRFASKRTDAGLVFFGRRYYSPSLGRWLTPDPLGYTDG
ncbi:MAG: hypothetical protein HW387_189, partial [Parachlamydiales bacterium]|nr:hypothetical protein [Parachlamydiales bacterium]